MAGIGILALVFDSLAVVPTHVGMGPFKQGLLIALAYLFLIAFDLRWNGYSRGSAIAWGLAILALVLCTILGNNRLRTFRKCLNQIFCFFFRQVII